MSDINVNPSLQHRITVNENGCWLWLGNISKEGYGRASRPRGDGTYETILAHVLSYELHIGVVPEGKILHHINMCGHKRCINPTHLEPLTREEHRHTHADPNWFPCGHPR